MNTATVFVLLAAVVGSALGARRSRPCTCRTEPTERLDVRGAVPR